MSEMVFVGGRVLVGDCRVVLADVPDGSVDSCVTDPPYDLTNRTPDVKGCEDCGRTLGGRDGNPEVCPKCGGVLSMQRSVQGKGGGGFMGHGWDSTGVAFDVGTWAEVLRVLKPGGHVVAFGATRSYHRMVVAIEDAGFEIRDTIMAWGYGTGFPKSHNVSKAIDKAAGAEREVVGTMPWSNAKMDAGEGVSGLRQSGGFAGEYRSERVSLAITAPATEDAARWDGWGTALKPAIEPIVLARKPLVGTVVANVLEHGTGGLNIDASRIVGQAWASVAPNAGGRRGGIMGEAVEHPGGEAHSGGRFPANLVLVHHPDCRPTGGTRKVKGDTARVGNLPPEGGKRGDVPLAPVVQRGAPGEAHGYAVNGVEEVEAWVCVEGCPVASLDAQSGPLKSQGGAAFGRDTVYQGSLSAERGDMRDLGYGDTSGASRFFARFGWAIDEHIEQAGALRYVTKAPGKERPSYEVLDPPTTMLRLRDDLTDEQRAHVLERLREAGVDVG